jgi:hypothetical protein
MKFVELMMVACIKYHFSEKDPLFLKIANPGKNLIFLLKNAKIWLLTAFFPLSDEGSKNCSKS